MDKMTQTAVVRNTAKGLRSRTVGMTFRTGSDLVRTAFQLAAGFKGARLTREESAEVVAAARLVWHQHTAPRPAGLTGRVIQ